MTKPGYITVSFEYSRVVGPRSIHGGVTLSFEPAEEYSFASNAKWPSTDNYVDAVRQGIEEAFLRRERPLPGVRVTLKAVTWHDIYSCAAAFQTAARIAACAAFEA
jgi:hypothetical protein